MEMYVTKSLRVLCEAVFKGAQKRLLKDLSGVHCAQTYLITNRS